MILINYRARICKALFFEWECRWKFYFISILLYFLGNLHSFWQPTQFFKNQRSIAKMKTEKINYTRLYRTFSSDRAQHSNRYETSAVLPNSYSVEEYLPVVIKSSSLKIMGTTHRFIISSLSNLLHTADSLSHYSQRVFQQVEPLLVLQVEST